MRVAHVIAGLAARTGGTAAGVVEAALALDRVGVETTIFTTDLRGSASSGLGGRVPATELPVGSDGVDIRMFPARSPHRLAYSPALRNGLRASLHDYDVVDVHSLYLYPQYAAFREAARAGLPYVVTPHGALDPYLRPRGRARKALIDSLWQRRALERAGAVRVTAPDEAALMADVAPLVPRFVVPNAIDWDSFQTLPDGLEFRRRHLHGHAGPVVMYLGRMAHKKGLDVLIRAVASVARTNTDVVLAIVGPDDESLTPVLGALACDLGVDGRVSFVGMLHGRDRLAALAAADLWILPSRSENFAIALAEALAAGLATIVSPAVNIAEAVHAADAAVICEPETADLADAILALLADGERRAKLGANARVFARRYDRAAVGTKLADMYETVMSGAYAGVPLPLGNHARV